MNLHILVVYLSDIPRYVFERPKVQIMTFAYMYICTYIYVNNYINIIIIISINAIPECIFLIEKDSEKTHE
jgi:hypothetical protein